MRDKEKKAIERLRIASEMSLTHYKKPLLLTYSGGKDSAVLLDLAEKAGVPFEVLHNHTTVDAPETVYHVRKEFHRLENKGINCNIRYPVYKGEKMSMWKLIPQKSMPPTRIARYCCEILKENGGNGRMIATGVRWAESSKRKSRGIYENINRDPNRRIVLNNDNDDRRRLFENCIVKAERTCNPIIDWSNEEVWDYVHSEKLPINPVYHMGFERVGCIGCPMATTRMRLKEFATWPRYKQNYISAFGRMLELKRAKGLNDVHNNAEEVYHWWIQDGVLPGQIEMELNEEE